MFGMGHNIFWAEGLKCEKLQMAVFEVGAK
jgi:hypothetical protein